MRLVRQFLDTGAIAKRYRSPAKGFARKYPAADVALLAETDALHDTLSGPATRHLMQLAFAVFGDTLEQGLSQSFVQEKAGES